MNWIGLAAIVAAVVLLLIARRSSEYDRAGNPALRLRPPAAALLPMSLYFILEAASFRAGESFRLHPFTFYLLLTMGVLFLLSSALLFNFKITVEPRVVTQSLPPFWRRTLSLTQLEEIQDDPLIRIVRFSGGRQISVIPLYSGVRGFLDYLRQFHAELTSTSEA